MNKIYVDSNIFLNLWFAEMQRLDPVFHFAERLLREIVDCSFFLVISDLTLKELSRRMNLPAEKVRSDYFDQYEVIGKLKVVEVTQDVKDKAQRLPTHLSDAIHAVVAKREESILVTRNTKDFVVAARNLGLVVRLPEELT